MVSKPLVSTIIPTYNRPEKLLRAVDSVIDQTYDNIEIIVVNDCPQKDVRDILPSEDSIRYIHHKKNRGSQIARNNGIKLAEGEYIAFLDDDDAWKSKKIEKQVEKLESLDNTYGMVYCGRDVVKNNKIIKKYQPEHDENVNNILLKKNIIPSECPLIRHECFKTVGMFDPDFLSLQDIDLWLRITEKYKTAVISESLAINYIGHEDRITNNLEKQYQGHKQFLHKYKYKLESDPSALAVNQRRLGIYASMTGRKQEGTKNLYNAYKNNLYNMKIFAELIVSFIPDPLRTKLFSLRKVLF